MKSLLKKICHRIYLAGKNVESSKTVSRYPEGVSLSSTNKNFHIGSDVSFGNEVLLMGAGKIEIGNGTMIAAGVIIHTSTHDYNVHPMRSKRIDLDVKIGQHVWIGTGAIICPGSVVRDYSVVGAGCVVVAEVKEGEIVGGVPATKLGSRNLSEIIPSINSAKK